MKDHDFKTLSTPEAKFNAGLAKLQRIDYLRKAAHLARIDSNNDRWFKVLGCIRSEINERLTNGEKVLANEYEGNINKGMIDNRRSIQNHRMPKSPVSHFLNIYELYLGELEFKYGLSLPNKDSGMDSISEME